MLRKIAFVLTICLCFGSSGLAQATRHFTFHYAFTVKDVPAGEPVLVWFPEAHNDAFQEVRVVSAKGDLDLKKNHESRLEMKCITHRRGKENPGICILRWFMT